MYSPRLEVLRSILLSCSSVLILRKTEILLMLAVNSWFNKCPVLALPFSFSKSFIAYKTFLSNSDRELSPKSFSILFNSFFNSIRVLFIIVMAQVSLCYFDSANNKILFVSRKQRKYDKKSIIYSLVEFILYIRFTLIASWRLVEKRIVLVQTVA